MIDECTQLTNIRFWQSSCGKCAGAFGRWTEFFCMYFLREARDLSGRAATTIQIQKLSVFLVRKPFWKWKPEYSSYTDWMGQKRTKVRYICKCSRY